MKAFSRSSSRNLKKTSGAKLALDATGFSSSYSSSYYIRKIKGKEKRKSYLKLHALEDIDSQLILAAEVSKGREHEASFLIPLLKKIPDSLGIAWVAADKAYDSKENHYYIQTKLKAKSVIKINKRGSKKVKGLNERAKVFRKFKEPERKKKYRKRSLVETAFSVIKRLFSGSLKAKKFITRKIELFFKVIAYNVRRLVLLDHR